MVRVVIYGEHKEETEGLEGMLRAILTEKQRWPVIHTYIGNLESYLHFVRGNPYLIMLVSVMGKKGAQTVPADLALQPLRRYPPFGGSGKIIPPLL